MTSTTATTVPSDTREYSRIEYWDKRFEGEDDYEWCGKFSDFADLLVEALNGGGRRGGEDGGGGGGRNADACADATAAAGPPARRVLIIGSGTSRLPFDLAEASRSGLLPELEEVVATDLSRVAVDKMRARAERAERAEAEAEEEQTGDKDGKGDVDDEQKRKKRKGAMVTWLVADILSLPFPPNSFDAVVDKGVLDALFAGSKYDKWRPRESASGAELWDVAHRALSESHRVLKEDGGCYVQISFEQPHFRKLFLDAEEEGEDGAEEGGEGGGKSKKKKKKRYDWRGSERAFGPDGGLQFFFYERRRRRRSGGVDGDGDEEENDDISPPPYVPAESPMHDHMDDESFLFRTTL